MMLGEADRRHRRFLEAAQRRQFAAQQRFEIELFLEPYGHRGGERKHTPRSITQVGFEQAVELQQAACRRRRYRSDPPA